MYHQNQMDIDKDKTTNKKSRPESYRGGFSSIYKLKMLKLCF